jgi:heme A synthase
MNKWFYILMGIFGPVPALIFGWMACDYQWIPMMKAVVQSTYILNAVLLLAVRFLGGAKRSIKNDQNNM